jgi:hypothetical protein
MATPIQPVLLERNWTVGDLLAETFRLFARHAVLFCSITAVVVMPYVVAVDAVWGEKAAKNGYEDSSAAGIAVPLLLSTLIVPSFVTALHVVALLRMSEGERPSPAEALRMAMPRVLPAMGATALYFVAIVLGTVLLIVPGIFLSIRLFFGAQAAVVDGLAPMDALRRSNELVRGHWWQTLGRLLLSGIVFGIVSIPLALTYEFIDFGVVYVLLDAAVQTVVLSLGAIFGTLMFMDYHGVPKPPQSEPEPTYGGFDPPRPAGPRMA